MRDMDRLVIFLCECVLRKKGKGMRGKSWIREMDKKIEEVYINRPRINRMENATKPIPFSVLLKSLILRRGNWTRLLE